MSRKTSLCLVKLGASRSEAIHAGLSTTVNNIIHVHSGHNKFIYN